jgi:nitronate monooxygenase
MSLPTDWRPRLRLPLVVAPMLTVSGPELVAAACAAGVIGAFPTANCRSADELTHWMRQIRDGIAARGTPLSAAAPIAANLIVHSPQLQDHLQVLLRERVELVITSVGSPRALVRPLHDIGCRVWADVASLRHAEKALADGVDGLILLTAGAGGQTGWANPFAFVRTVRPLFDGPLVLSGGLTDGQALWAARVLGADLGYMGTRFIATPESQASPAYRQMLQDSTLDDVLQSSAFSGLPANWLRGSLLAAGLDPDAIDPQADLADAAEMFGASARPAARRWSQLLSAGHSVSGVQSVLPVAELVRLLASQYDAAHAACYRPDF